MTWKTALMMAIAMLAAAPAAAQVPTCTPAKLECTGGACRVDVQFPDKAVKCRLRIDDGYIRATNATTPGTASRITENTVVRVRVLHANLFRYSVAMDTKETEVETYVYLLKLWKQVAGLGLLPTDDTADVARSSDELAFVRAINGWRGGLATANADLDRHLGDLAGLNLSEAGEASIKTMVASLADTRKRLEGLQMTAQGKITRSEHFAVYDATAVTHKETLDRLDAYESVASVALNGFQKRITFGKAGRVVAVTVTAKHKGTDQEAKEAIGIEFFVHSTLPVTFHAGYAVRAMEEIDYEAVGSSLASAGGADLFTKVQDSNANGTFTAFLSYRLGPADSLRRLPQLTIGTDFKDVGERLYGGISLPIGRAFLTVGAVNGETEEAAGKVTETLGTVGDLVGARELFTTVASKRKWGAFVGLSFAPF